VKLKQRKYTLGANQSSEVLNMPRGPCSFKQRDVVRALRATRAAGMEVTRLEIAKDGTIILVAGKSEAQESEPLDRWMADNARQT
jgi:hypothetical protein